MLFTGTAALHASESNVESQLQLLEQQNQVLQNQLHEQQELIDSLRHDVTEIREANKKREAESAETRNESAEPAQAAASSGGFSFGKVHLSGEGAAGIFETGSQGAFPNAEFRVDEARLFVDAQVWGDVYAFAEVNMATREEPDVDFHLGECYLDAEDISKLWGQTGQLNARVGRMYIPFGEEYLNRYAIDNPLISHSLSDLWGVDEGFELYGSFGKFSYVAAVQNGGIPDTRDFNADKSVAGRLSFDLNPQFHFSVSGMRTGNLNSQQDMLSAQWFAGGFFRSLGAGTMFDADLVEGDAEWRFNRGHLKAFGGYIHYGDNDPTADNQRDVYYYSVEGIHDVTKKLYAGARFSQIFARKGFPIVGNGDMNEFLFGPLTEEMWRLSVGLGYRWNQHLVLKTEYSLERGREVGGINRDHEDLLAAELAFGF